MDRWTAPGSHGQVSVLIISVVLFVVHNYSLVFHPDSIQFTTCTEVGEYDTLKQKKHTLNIFYELCELCDQGKKFLEVLQSHKCAGKFQPLALPLKLTAFGTTVKLSTFPNIISQICKITKCRTLYLGFIEAIWCNLDFFSCSCGWSLLRSATIVPNKLDLPK